jgi:hypothetical protein
MLDYRDYTIRIAWEYGHKLRESKSLGGGSLDLLEGTIAAFTWKN